MMNIQNIIKLICLVVIYYVAKLLTYTSSVVLKFILGELN